MIQVTGSLNLTQEEVVPPVPEEGDVAIPMIGGNMDPAEVKANFNALLYLVTEQMAVQLKILDLLVDKGLVTEDDINDKVVAVTGEKEALTQVYNEMFARFVGYYSALRQMEADGKIFTKEDISE